MSGHSKWSTIKRQKGAADIKRGAAFTKISNAITIAVKQGGGIGDPNQNPRLRLAIESARTANMPKDNIERAIARATAKGAGELSEVTYEGFTPGGASVLIEAVTDNTNRTTSEVKSLFNKSGASFGQPGSVAYQFNQTGEIIVNKNSYTLDDIFLTAAEAGALDVEDNGEEVSVFTNISDLSTVKEALSAAGFEVSSAEISRKPINLMEVGEEDKEKIINFLSTLESMDDIQKVYSNISLA
ncbi:YebC/PmpR family DNA-binding transcriptional regulator [Candidatus Dojkabacteria bacterium]|uniref:Probable transcriptional regulatory protein E6Q11_06965 n=1 Tax=Candidatus Dojkabacteria bacterium TaxID=2099670 RepID=A0A5C7J2H0_9BACT|nr:MAG: YebC/PmpR family DNA-binding transcriptional regulator [Candidatus Dojkabacteria bacterium]